MAVSMELLLWTVPDLENSDDSRYLSLALADHTGYYCRVRLGLLPSLTYAEELQAPWNSTMAGKRIH